MTTPAKIRHADPSTVVLKAKTPLPTVLCPAVDGPVLIYNADITNVIYAGYRPEVNAQNGTPVQPLTSTVMSGDRQLYGYNPNAADVIVNITPGGISQSPSPAQISQQINALGLMKDTTGIAIKGSTDNITPAVNAPGYGPITTVNPGLLSKDTSVTGLPTSDWSTSKLAKESGGNLDQIPIMRDRVALAGSTIAGDVKVTGAPLLRNEVAVSNGATAAIAAGGTATIGPFTFNTPSYEIRVVMTAAAAATICNGEVTLKWSNSGGGTELARKTFSAIASTGGHAVSITGPVRGSSLSIVFTNASTSTQNVTFTYTIVASSRVAANDLYRSIAGVGAGAPTAESWAGNVMDSGILANGTPSVATGVTVARGLGAYNGPCRLCVVTGSGTTDCRANIAIMDTTLAANTGAIFDSFTDSKGRINTQIDMPMSQCVLNLTNSNAGTQTLSFILTTAEPNVN